MIPPMRIRIFTWMFVALFFAAIAALASESSTAVPDEQELLEGKVFISALKPQRHSGAGYKLVYLVDAPIEVFWKFKTDFDNDFLLTNKFIKSHQMIRRRGNVVVTEDLFSEDLYTHRPLAKFRWQTTIWPAEYRMEFILLNPEECGQKFHHGHIQLEAFEAVNQKTKVTQVAYFDFFGVSFWVKYPWYGGMRYFLEYTARWEQDTILKLKDAYIKKSAQ
jgi:ligand-binding SRPBCC domain-containing protein